MSQEAENFEQLRKLLALKRHEIPPPGYFDGFSRQVTAQIRAGKGRETSWLHNFWSLFESKPMLSGAFGAAVCLLLVLGLVYTERMDSSSAGVASVAGQSDVPGPLALNDPAGHAPGFAVADTNGAAPELSALFNQLPLQSVPAAANGSVVLPTK